MRAMTRKLAADGGRFFLSTHLLDAAEPPLPRVAIIQRGKLQASDARRAARPLRGARIDAGGGIPSAATTEG